MEKSAFLSIFVVVILFSFIVIKNVYCVSNQVLLEFLYYKPCSKCPTIRKYYDVYLHNSKVLANIQRDYGEKVVVEQIPFYSSEGIEKVKQYNLSFMDWNSVIVNHKVVLVGGDKPIDEILLRQVIDTYLGGQYTYDIGDSLNTSVMGLLVTSFILGFFETFSPCLIIMLSFIASYTLGDKTGFREGFVKIMIFGVGFVSASAIIGLACGLFLLSVPNLQSYLTMAICIFAVIFGLNLLGILKFPFSIQAKPFIKKITRKYVFTYIGIFMLGFIFYFLDPCIAPVFASMAAALFSNVFLLGMLTFCIGSIIPFVGIGLLTGSISKITRKVYKYRQIFKGISGIILISYALYLITSILLL